MKKLLLILLVLSITSVSGQSNWEITNTPFGGTIWDIEGSDSEYLYAIAGSGLCRSENNGNTWEHVTFENGIIRVLTVTGSGDIFASHDSLVYKSTDQGNTWELVLTASGSFISLDSGPQDAVYGSTMGANGEMTLHLSSDGGQTWEQKPMDFTSYSHLNLHVNTTGDIFSASFEGLYRSVDQGDTWVMINGGAVRSLLITSAGELIIGIYYDNWLYKSSDNGLNWTQLFWSPGIYPLAEDTAGYIYAPSASGLFRISPDGLHWSQINKGLPPDEIYAMYVNQQNDVFAGNDGIYMSTNNGIEWTLSSTGLNTDSFNFMTSSADGDIYVISDALYMSSDEGASYTKLVSFNDYDKILSRVFIHPDGEIFALGSGRYFTGDNILFRSTDNGTTFSELIHLQIHDFAISPNGSIFLACSNGLLRSIDKGDTWELIHQSGNCFWYDHLLISQTGTIYLSGCNGTYTSNDNGETFSQIADVSFNLQSSNSQGHVFAFDQSSIYRSTNGGTTWEEIYTNDLPYNQLKDLIVDANDNVYFSLSFMGIYKSDDNGDTWVLFNEGLINTNVIAMHATSNGTLYIAPEYNGVWKRSAMPTLAGAATNLEVYPNPAREKITIRLSGASSPEGEICNIYDMQGRMMKEVVISSHSNEIGLEGFEPGVYLVKSSNSVQKVLIQ